MRLNEKTLEKLRDIIDGDNTAEAKSGSQLVKFFNQLGFDDVYKSPFPSRWQYTDEKLRVLNGTDRLWECIKLQFSVIDYIECLDVLDSRIAEFNKYLAFDKLKVVRKQNELLIEELPSVIVDEPKASSEEQQFLALTFKLDVGMLYLEEKLKNIIENRIEEIRICTENGAYLSAVIMTGSVMEAVLLGAANRFPELFNRASDAPRNDGTTRRFRDWSLSNFIDVAFELEIITLDVKKFSHALRDFRNLVHPNEQLSLAFYPDKNTALICFQVLKAAIDQIGKYNRIHMEVG